jgi:hypothetical protein
VGDRVTLALEMPMENFHSNALKRDFPVIFFATRITKEGVLWLVAQRSRSQIDNRKEAVARFVELLRRALRREKPRRKSVVPDTERRRRFAEKRRRGQVKRRRSAHPPAGDEEE